MSTEMKPPPPPILGEPEKKTRFLFASLPQNWGRGGLLLLAALVLAGCGHKRVAVGDAGGDKKDAPVPTVQVVPVTRGVLERTLPVTGTLLALPGQEAALSAPVTGVLESLYVRTGQTVQKGEVVARLSTRQLLGQIQQAQATLGQNHVQVQQAEANALQQQAQTRTTILQAQAGVRNAQATLAGTQATLTGNLASLRNAEQSLARARTLFADGLIPQKDVEAADLSVRTAQAQVDAQRQTVAGQRQTVAGQQQAVAAAHAASLQDIVKRKDVQVAEQQVRNAQGALQTARSQLALYTLRAPLAGQVTVVGATVGETVDTTAKIVTITNLDRLQLQVAVPAASEAQVRAGERVTFTASSLPGQVLQTTILRVGSQVDAATGTVPAYAVVANPGHRLRDDTTVQAHIVTERRAGVLLAPQSAVLRDPDTGKASVVVVGQDEVAHVTPVTLGLSAGGQTEIKSGVSEGQRVAVSGQYGLPDGAKVSAQNGQASTPATGESAQDISAPGSPGVPERNAPPASGGGSGGSTQTPSQSAGPSQSAPGVSPSAPSSPVPNAPASAPQAAGGAAPAGGSGSNAGAASPGAGSGSGAGSASGAATGGAGGSGGAAHGP